MFKKVVYWIRYGISCLFLWPGFWIYDIGIWFCAKGNKLQEFAIAIEGDVPEGCEEKR